MDIWWQGDHGDMVTWRHHWYHGDMNTRRHGDMEPCWRGDMVTWFHDERYFQDVQHAAPSADISTSI
eukprot:10906885-Karenia_brevis.AAC.1